MRNRIREYDWLPHYRGTDGAFTGMPKSKQAVVYTPEVFARNFSRRLEAWVAQDPARSDRLFANFIGIEPRNVAKWKADGLTKFKPGPNDPLGVASDVLGIDPESWWDETPKEVEPMKFPSGYDIKMTETLIQFVQRQALLRPEFRRAVQDLMDKEQG